MKLFSRSFLAGVSLLCLLMLAACGSSTGSGTSGPYGGGGGGATPTAAPSSSSALIKTTSATVNGASETILTNAQGMTLYYRTSDTASSVCSGGCASAWPPVLASGANAPASAGSLPGTLTVMSDANGSQIAYNGHPLYTYASDTSPGQMSGQGAGGVWFVVPTTLSTQNPAPAASPTQGSGYGNGYGYHRP